MHQKEAISQTPGLYFSLFLPLAYNVHTDLMGFSTCKIAQMTSSHLAQHLTFHSTKRLFAVLAPRNYSYARTYIVQHLRIKKFKK